MSERTWRAVFSVAWVLCVFAALTAADAWRGDPIWWRFNALYPIVVVLVWWAGAWCWRRIGRRRPEW